MTAESHLLQGSEGELHPQDLFVQLGPSKILHCAHCAVQVGIHVFGHHLDMGNIAKMGDMGNGDKARTRDVRNWRALFITISQCYLEVFFNDSQQSTSWV